MIVPGAWAMGSWTSCLGYTSVTYCSNGQALAGMVLLPIGGIIGIVSIALTAVGARRLHDAVHRPNAAVRFALQ